MNAKMEAYILNHQGELKVDDVVQGFYPDNKRACEQLADLDAELKKLSETYRSLPRGSGEKRGLLGTMRLVRNRKRNLGVKLMNRERKVKECFFALWVHGKVKQVEHRYCDGFGWRKGIYTIEERRREAIGICRNQAEEYRRLPDEDKTNIFVRMSLSNVLDAVAVLEKLEFTPYAEKRFSLNVEGLWHAATHHYYYIDSLFEITCCKPTTELRRLH